MNEDRDTHFQGFAKLLFDELYESGDVWFDVLVPSWEEDWRQIIAHRVYDLLAHNAPDAPIQDITEWPEQ